MRRLSVFLIGLLMFISCEEKVELSLETKNTELLIVEGTVTNENKNHLVKLSLPYANQNGESESATGASVYLFEDSTAVALTEFPQGSGNYYTPVLRGLFGKLYTLVIQYKGKVFFAQDSPVPVQPMNELSYRETTNGFTLNLNPQDGDPNYVDHTISWRHTPECAGGNFCDGRVVFYDLKTIDVHQVFKPDQEVVYFPRNSIVIRRKYSISPRYKAFLRSMLSETQWRGGVFDVQRENVITNLSPGAAGFFAVCSVVADTTLVQ